MLSHQIKSIIERKRQNPYDSSCGANIYYLGHSGEHLNPMRYEVVMYTADDDKAHTLTSEQLGKAIEQSIREMWPDVLTRAAEIVEE